MTKVAKTVATPEVSVAEKHNLKRRALNKGERVQIVSSMIFKMYDDSVQQWKEKYLKTLFNALEESVKPSLALFDKHLKPAIEKTGADNVNTRFALDKYLGATRSFTVKESGPGDRERIDFLCAYDSPERPIWVQNNIKGSWSVPVALDIADLKVSSACVHTINTIISPSYHNEVHITDTELFKTLLALQKEYTTLMHEIEDTASTVGGILNECKKAEDVLELLPNSLEFLPKEQASSPKNTALIPANELDRINGMLNVA